MSQLVDSTDLITVDEAASMLKVSPQTLAVWRSAKRWGLPYVKVGRLVRYSRTAVEKWLQSNTKSPATTDQDADASSF